MTLVAPGRETQFSRGICPGEIIDFERGAFGFGYDSLFQLDGMALTMTELDMQEKHQFSHRVHATIPFIQTILL